MDKEILGFALLGFGAILLVLDAMELGLNIPADLVTAAVIPTGLLMLGV